MAVQAYHVIFGAYGFWLPNDPRGSWSDFVAAWELFRFGGKATKVDTRLSVAAKPHDRVARIAAKERLKYPAVSFTGVQAQAVGHAFGAASRDLGIVVAACSILPEHVHLVLGRSEYTAETMVRMFKAEASKRLREDGLHPLAQFKDEEGSLPTPWARRCWKVFLDSDEDVARAIEYVERNPIKEGLPAQRWKFVSSR